MPTKIFKLFLTETQGHDNIILARSGDNKTKRDSSLKKQNSKDFKCEKIDFERNQRSSENELIIEANQMAQ